MDSLEFLVTDTLKGSATDSMDFLAKDTLKDLDIHSAREVSEVMVEGVEVSEVLEVMVAGAEVSEVLEEEAEVPGIQVTVPSGMPWTMDRIGLKVPDRSRGRSGSSTSRTPRRTCPATTAATRGRPGARKSPTIW